MIGLGLRRLRLRLERAEVSGACEGSGSEWLSPGSRRPAASNPKPSKPKARRLGGRFGFAPVLTKVSDGRIYVVNVSKDPLLSGCLTWTLLPGDRIPAVSVNPSPEILLARSSCTLAAIRAARFVWTDWEFNQRSALCDVPASIELMRALLRAFGIRSPFRAHW